MAKVHAAPSPEKLYELQSDQACVGGRAEYIGLAYYTRQGRARLQKLDLMGTPNTVETGFSLAKRIMRDRLGISVEPKSFFVVRACHEHGSKHPRREAFGGIIVAHPDHGERRIDKRDITLNAEGLGRLALDGIDAPLVLLPSYNTDEMAELVVVQAADSLYVARHRTDPIAIYTPDSL